VTRTFRNLLAAPLRRLLRPSAARSDSNDASSSSAAIDRWNTSEPAPAYAQPGSKAIDRLNCLCWIEDWDHPARLASMRRLLPSYVEDHPTFPRGFEHRKHWEFAQVAVGLEQLGALGPASLVLAVGAGHEELIFDLTTRAQWVFATDIYGTGSFSSGAADARMLLDPDHFASSPYNRNRLVVQQMDALDLRFEEGTFDAVYSLSAIEHFGAVEGAKRALGEMARVLKPGGIAALTTECIVNDAPAYSAPGQELFTPNALRTLCSSHEDVVPVQELDFSLSDRTSALPPVPLIKAIEDSKRGHVDYPHILLELEGRVFTSFSVFLKKSTS
jgi:SAM-dependent methyltransferase